MIVGQQNAYRHAPFTFPFSLFREWDAGRKAGSRARLALNAQYPAEQLHALVDAGQPEMAGGRAGCLLCRDNLVRRETAPIVLHSEAELAVDDLQAQGDMAGLRVPVGVRERFLGNAVEGIFDALR